MIVASLTQLIVVNFPNVRCSFILVRNHVNHPTSQLFIRETDFTTQLIVNLLIGAESVKRLNDQKVYVHPNWAGPIVVSKSVVGVVDAQTSDSVRGHQSSLIRNHFPECDRKSGIFCTYGLQKQWPEVKVSSVSIELFFAICVDIEIIKHLAICIPELIQQLLCESFLLLLVKCCVICFIQDLSYF